MPNTNEYTPYSTTGLPVLPYTFITEYDGIKYETHVLTNTRQVITEDGISLSEVLDNLITTEELNIALKTFDLNATYFKFKGILSNLPDITAIDQLYAKTGMFTGEVWLVEADKPDVIEKVYEMYTYVESISKWVYCGSTSKQTGELPEGYSKTLKLFPDKLGKPGQYLIVTEDGAGLTWGYAGGGDTPVDIPTHDVDPDAHLYIQNKINLKADKLVVFNDTIHKDGWSYPGDDTYFNYIYTNKNIPDDGYFEITPVFTTFEQSTVLKNAELHPIYSIHNTDEGAYAILRAKHVPTADIQICVKCYGSYNPA